MLGWPRWYCLACEKRREIEEWLLISAIELIYRDGGVIVAKLDCGEGTMPWSVDWSVNYQFSGGMSY